MLYRVHEMKRMEDKLVERSATLDYTPSKGMSGSAETSLECIFLGCNYCDHTRCWMEVPYTCHSTQLPLLIKDIFFWFQGYS